MDQKKGVVRGICISKKRGTAKYPVESARIVPDWGIEEDAHGGKCTDRSASLHWRRLKRSGNREQMWISGHLERI